MSYILAEYEEGASVSLPSIFTQTLEVLDFAGITLSERGILRHLCSEEHQALCRSDYWLVQDWNATHAQQFFDPRDFEHFTPAQNPSAPSTETSRFLGQQLGEKLSTEGFLLPLPIACLRLILTVLWCLRLKRYYPLQHFHTSVAVILFQALILVGFKWLCFTALHEMLHDI